MLDTQFERLPGDIGNPQSFDFMVRYRTVQRAWAHRVVDFQFDEAADCELIEAFVQEALLLEAQGATLITTSCGFMFVYQEQIQARLRVPFISSSLLWLVTDNFSISLRDMAQTQSATLSIGVLTFDLPAFVRLQSVLDRQMLKAGIELVVQAMPPQGNFVSVIRSNQAKFDTLQCAKEVAQVVEQLMNRAHDPLNAIVLECTNLSPYALLIEQLSGCPVFDLNRLLHRASRV